MVACVKNPVEAPIHVETGRADSLPLHLCMNACTHAHKPGILGKECELYGYTLVVVDAYTTAHAH
jgi:hypothetical protein